MKAGKNKTGKTKHKTKMVKKTHKKMVKNIHKQIQKQVLGKNTKKRDYDMCSYKLFH